MALNGISTLRTGKRNSKGKRQRAKLKMAEAKRQGRTIISGDGNYLNESKYGRWNHSGAIDTTAAGWRGWNVCNIYYVAMRYNINSGNIVPDWRWTDPDGEYKHNSDHSISADLVDNGNALWPRRNRPWRQSVEDGGSAVPGHSNI